MRSLIASRRFSCSRFARSNSRTDARAAVSRCARAAFVSFSRSRSSRKRSRSSVSFCSRARSGSSFASICPCSLFFFFSSRRRHTSSVSAFLLNRSSDLGIPSYFATFRHQLTILSKTDALDEEKWLNMLGTFVKDWFRYESHFVHGRDSLVDILKERGLLSES